MIFAIGRVILKISFIDWFNCVCMRMHMCGVWVYLHKHVILCVMCVTV